MRRTIVALPVILVTLSGPWSLADECTCVYPWPKECNDKCIIVSGTVVKAPKGEHKAVIAVDEKTKVTFVVSEDAKGKNALEEGRKVEVLGRQEGPDKVILDVKPLAAKKAAAKKKAK